MNSDNQKITAAERRDAELKRRLERAHKRQVRREGIIRQIKGHMGVARSLIAKHAPAHSQRRKKSQKPCRCSGKEFSGTSVVVLRTQSDVDTFGAEQYVIVNQSLLISSDQVDPIVSLSPLSTLCEVSGNLQFFQNNELISLAGLENLRRVGGDLLFDGNEKLESIDQLSSLQTVGQDLDIFNNMALSEISALNCLEFVGGLLSIDGNNSLSNISGFNAARKLCVLGDLDIRNNEKLISIDGFNGLERIGGTLDISANALLECIRGFERLESVESLLIEQHPSLVNICAFHALTCAIDEIFISSNTSLQQVCAFQNLRQVEDLFFIENPVLAKLATFEHLRTLRDLQLGGQSALPDLDAFACLQDVRDDVILLQNSALENIDGLINLRSVEDRINIAENGSLTTLAGLSRLQESRQLMNEISVTFNAALDDFCGLQALAAADPNGDPQFSISQNASNPTKEQIAQLSPCDARQFFKRTLNRWLANKTLKRSVACSLAHCMSKKAVRKWACAKCLSFAQEKILLGALDHCLFADEDQLPPHGPPLQLDIACSAQQLSGSERFAFRTACCTTKPQKRTVQRAKQDSKACCHYCRE